MRQPVEFERKLFTNLDVARFLITVAIEKGVGVAVARDIAVNQSLA